MGGNDIMGSELIFSDTVHQFLQVLTMTHKYVQFIYSKIWPKNTPSLIFSEGGGVVLRPSLFYMQ